MLQLISILLAFSTPALSATYSAKGCYSLSDLSSHLTSKGEYTYQSNSYCQEQCSGYSVAATLGGSTCYCGNELPADVASVSSSNCAISCQGYPDEVCGGNGYLSVFTTGSEDTDDENASTSNGKSTNAGNTAASTTTGNTAITTTGPTTQATGTTSVATSVRIITSVVSGSQTITTETSTASATSSNTNKSSDSSSGLSGGAIGGIVGGVCGGLVVIAAIIFFIWYKKRNNDEDEDDEMNETTMKDPENPPNIFGDFYSTDNFNNVNRPIAPFQAFGEEHKRLSNGSLPDARQEKFLRIVNPDETLAHRESTLHNEDRLDDSMSESDEDDDWRK